MFDEISPAKGTFLRTLICQTSVGMPSNSVAYDNIVLAM